MGLVVLDLSYVRIKTGGLRRKHARSIEISAT